VKSTAFPSGTLELVYSLAGRQDPADDRVAADGARAERRTQ
jgi:hypothetical protein